MKNNLTKTLVLLLLVLRPSVSMAADKPDTPHLDFVKEFISELAAVEEIRASGEAELRQDQARQDQVTNSLFSNMIHTATLYKLELNSQIAMLNTMHLSGPFGFLIPSLTGIYRAKIDVWNQMSGIATTFMEGLKPGVDYGGLEAEMPQLRAKLDFADQSIFKLTPAVFATLVDMKPDSKGHASHLIITGAERADLVKEIDTEFGPKLGQKKENYIVSSADALKAYLLKNFKSSDEPWE